MWRPWVFQASASAPSLYRRGWFKLKFSSEIPQPSGDHGFFRDQNPHPLYTEEVGSNIISPQCAWPPPAIQRPRVFQASASAHSLHRRGWFNLNSPQRYPGLPQPSEDHGFFRLQPPHPLCTEELGSNLTSPQRHPGLPQPSRDHGFFSLQPSNLRWLNYSSETPWPHPAMWRPWVFQAS
jgi:hypothetical protein